MPLWDVFRSLWTIRNRQEHRPHKLTHADTTTSSRIKAFRTVAKEEQGGPGRTDQPGRAWSRAWLHPGAIYWSPFDMYFTKVVKIPNPREELTNKYTSFEEEYIKTLQLYKHALRKL